MNSAAPTAQAADGPPARKFTVLTQHVALEVDLENRALRGATEIELMPLSADFDQIRLNGQQCKIGRVTVNGIGAHHSYHDPYKLLEPNQSHGVHQHHLYRSKIEPHLRKHPEQELVVDLPPNVNVLEDANPFAAATQNVAGKSRHTRNLSLLPDTPSVTSAVEQNATLTVIKLWIEFSVENPRDGFHFVGLMEGDGRYPHAYTRNSPFPGAACCIFPCVDDPQSRHTWTIDITSPRTLGDAVKTKPAPETYVPTIGSNGAEQSKYEANTQKPVNRPEEDPADGLTEEEAALEMIVVCSGEMTDESDHRSDPSRKVTSFSCSAAVSVNQIGFAIGPFEKVDLSEYREIDDDEKLGEEAVRVHGFCLPGRASEVRNSCLPMAKAVDYYTTTFTTYPFSSYKLCFLDDLQRDSTVTAGLSFYSSRLLFPEDIIDPIYEVTRKLVHGLAAQYAGISFTANQPSDLWCVTGMAYFMTDLFLKVLMGENEYRYRQKLAADQVFEQDHDRPSLHALGSILHLDLSEAEFLALKSSVVLFILDRRIMKLSGSTGMARIIGRTITNAKAGDPDLTSLSTPQFLRTCEKLGHTKLDKFFNQWVYGAGCPEFEVTPTFNKRQLSVQVRISQRQGTESGYHSKLSRDLNPDHFMRDVNEDLNAVYAGEIKPVFTGPMTIRIHEADGTPYEHIVEIKEATQIITIPYNTKYKRLKRNKKQKKQPSKNAKADTSEDVDDDYVINRLGDVLESREDFENWHLDRWSEQDEKKMNDESYEWVRMDADFEWICKMNVAMPFYMYVSQLQQDKDVVAQLESLQYIKQHPPSRIASTYLTRTIMDSRYFHGIRTTAASILPNMATSEMGGLGFLHLDRIFSALFCVSLTSPITRQNDFSDRVSYLVQCAIPRAISTIKNKTGHAPMPVKRFFTDKLKFNDNATNDFSDCYYVSLLLKCLAATLVPAKNAQAQFFASDEEEMEELAFKRDAIAEIERHRRIDEWIPSFHNVYSLSALDCLVRLAKANVLQPKISDLLQYTRPGNAEMVRIKGFDALVELGKFRNDAVAKFLIHCLSEDPSPFMRDSFYQLFGKGLGKIAVGDDQPEPGVQNLEGLIIEDEGLIETRQADLARRQTVAGAMTALKEDIAKNETLKSALWDAVTSPALALSEVSRLLDILSVLYEPKKLSKMVTLTYPKYWKVRYEGNGMLHFTKSDRFRTKLHIPSQPSAPPTATSPPIQINAGDTGSNAEAGAPRKVLKLSASKAAVAEPPQPESSAYTGPSMGPAPRHSGNLRTNGPASKRGNGEKGTAAAASPATVAGGRRGSTPRSNNKKQQPKSALKAKPSPANTEPPRKKQKLVRFKVPKGEKFPSFLLDSNGDPRPNPESSPAPPSTFEDNDGPANPSGKGNGAGTKRKWTPAPEFGPIGTGDANVEGNNAARATYGPIGHGHGDNTGGTTQPTYGPISPRPPTPSSATQTHPISSAPMFGPPGTQWNPESGFSPVSPTSKNEIGDNNDNLNVITRPDENNAASPAGQSGSPGSWSVPNSKKRKYSDPSGNDTCVASALSPPALTGTPSGTAIESSSDGGGAAGSPGNGDVKERGAKRRRTSSLVSSPPDSATLMREGEQSTLGAKRAVPAPQVAGQVQKQDNPGVGVAGFQDGGENATDAKNVNEDAEMSDVEAEAEDAGGIGDARDSGAGGD